MRTFLVLCLVALAAAGESPYYYGRGEDQLSGQIGGAASNQVSQFDNGGGAADGGLDKEFFTFSANDDDFNEPASSDQIQNSLKKNLQVVFIKGPENHGLENSIADLAKHASEQRTAIYVLNKQADLHDLADKFNAESSHNHQKPEVHFVKYRTNADAEHAKHSIQSQYDQLGGHSQHHDGGVASAIDFSSRGGSHHGHHGGNGGEYSGDASAPSSHYLPANFLRLRRL